MNQYSNNARANGRAPFIVGIGGTTRPGSSTETALRATLRHAEELGAVTQLFGGDALASLPGYSPEEKERTEGQAALVEAVRRADAGFKLGMPLEGTVCQSSSLASRNAK